jgi:TIR domain
MNDYIFDLFVSYSRAGNVAGWVQRHFCEVLTNCLIDETGQKPRIFLDTRIDTGSYWPNELERGLRHSRLMVAVLSPPYFASRWCLAEWGTMILRERVLNMTTVETPGGLIYPLIFSDGKRFPDSAKKREGRSMKSWSYPYEQFSNTPAYLDFHDEMRVVASELATRLESIPAWNARWPIERPEAGLAAEPASLPAL